MSTNEWPDYEKWAWIKGYTETMMQIVCWRIGSGAERDAVGKVVLIKTIEALDRQGIQLQGDDWAELGRIMGRQWFSMTNPGTS